jgi:hypothetical protein
MNKITSSEFQSNFQRLDEPVTVMARSRTLGAWYPKGTVPVYIEEDGDPSPNLIAIRDQRDQAFVEIRHLKQLLAERATNGENVFTPAVAVRAGVRGESHPAPKGK